MGKNVVIDNIILIMIKKTHRQEIWNILHGFNMEGGIFLVSNLHFCRCWYPYQIFSYDSLYTNRADKAGAVWLQGQNMRPWVHWNVRQITIYRINCYKSTKCYFPWMHCYYSVRCRYEFRYNAFIMDAERTVFSIFF